MLHVVELITPGTTDGGARTSDVISLKNVQRCWVVCSSAHAAATAAVYTLMQATDVAAGTNKVLTNAVPITYNAACATSDVMTRATAAKNYTNTAAATHQIVIFQVDPDVALDVDNGYDCLYVTTSGATANTVLSVVALCEMRYEGDTVPSVIID